MDTEDKYDFDLFVIGGGSGGLSAAKNASKFGVQVGLADFVSSSPQGTTWGLGGTCVNVGCIPKKLFHFAALAGEIREDQKECGWDVDSSLPHNWQRMIEHVTAHIKKLNWGYRKQLIEKKIKYFNSLANLLDANTILLKDKNGKETKVTAKYILVAVGGRPVLLDLPGTKECVISSDDLFWMEKPPGRTLVIGAGYISVECSGFLRGLGYPVDLLYRETILRAFDKDMAKRVADYLVKSGVNLVKGLPLSFEKKENEISVKIKILLEDGTHEEIEKSYDTVLMAVGRYPDTERLGLREIGVEFDNFNKIKVDLKWTTSINNIFAIGDIVSGSPELTPVAIKEGEYLAEGLFGQRWRTIDYKSVPTTIFSPVEYSCCGLTEEKAIAELGEDNVEVYHSSFKPLEWNFLEKRAEGNCYCKILVNKENSRVIGIHYLGPNAGEVMQGFAIAVRLGLEFEDIKNTIGIHPTTAEELVTLNVVKGGDETEEKEGC